MPSVPLPENCQWPKATPPSDGLVPSILSYITLINSRCVWVQGDDQIVHLL